MSRDKEEHLYVPISPYTFGLDNPIFFIDPNGNTIRDANGKIVTIYYNDDGEVNGFDTDIEAGTREFLETALGSKVGRTQMAVMDDKRLDVTIKVENDVHIRFNRDTKDIEVPLASTSQPEAIINDEGETIWESTITVYKGNIGLTSDNLDKDQAYKVYSYSIKKDNYFYRTFYAFDIRRLNNKAKKRRAKSGAATDSPLGVREDALNELRIEGFGNEVDQFESLYNEPGKEKETFEHIIVHEPEHTTPENSELENPETPAYRRNIELIQEKKSE